MVYRTATGREKVPVLENDGGGNSDANSESVAQVMEVVQRRAADVEDGYPEHPTVIDFPLSPSSYATLLGAFARHFTGAKLKFEEVQASHVDAYGLPREEKKKKKKKTTVRHHVQVDMRTLFLTLGLWRGLAHDLAEYNDSTATTTTTRIPVEENTAAPDTCSAKTNKGVLAKRYSQHRMLSQLRACGVQRPPLGTTLSIPGLAALIAVIEEVYKETIETSKVSIATGACPFSALSELYIPGMNVIDRNGVMTGMHGVAAAFRVRSSFYREGKSMLNKVERTFHVALEYVVSTGYRFAVVEFTHIFTPFAGERICGDLDIAPLTEESDVLALETRGRVYERVALGEHFVGYAASAFLPMHAPLGSRSSKSKRTASFRSRQNRAVCTSVIV